MIILIICSRGSRVLDQLERFITKRIDKHSLSQFQVYQDLVTLKNFVIEYYNDYSYDMTEDWDTSWTFAKSLLFTVTIMTTIGETNLKNLRNKIFNPELLTFFFIVNIEFLSAYSRVGFDKLMKLPKRFKRKQRVKSKFLASFKKQCKTSYEFNKYLS